MGKLKKAFLSPYYFFFAFFMTLRTFLKIATQIIEILYCKFHYYINSKVAHSM